MKVIHGDACREFHNEIIYGQGEYRYRVLPGWIEMPKEMENAQIPGVFCNSKDELFVMTRNFDMPIAVFSPEGKYIKTMGWIIC